MITAAQFSPLHRPSQNSPSTQISNMDTSTTTQQTISSSSPDISTSGRYVTFADVHRAIRQLENKIDALEKGAAL